MKNLALRLNLATWILAIILLVIPAFGGMPAEQFTGHLIATLFWLAVYHLFFNYITPVYLMKKNLTAYFTIAVLSVFILPLLGYSLLFLSRALFSGSFDNFYNGYSIATHFSGVKAMVMAGLFGSLFRIITEMNRE